jgi:hypothetical protein
VSDLTRIVSPSITSVMRAGRHDLARLLLGAWSGGRALAAAAWTRQRVAGEPVAVAIEPVGVCVRATLVDEVVLSLGPIVEVRAVTVGRARRRRGQGGVREGEHEPKRGEGAHHRTKERSTGDEPAFGDGDFCAGPRPPARTRPS